MTVTCDRASGGAANSQQNLFGREMLLTPTWDDWLHVKPPFPQQRHSQREVQCRFSRNGYEWDVHSTLLTPENECDSSIAFVLTHGGAGSEFELLETPDGRPGLGRVLAAQGFRVLCITWVGHHHPSGRWTGPVAQRLPIYLLDRELPEAEVRDRMLHCTYNVTVEGMARLTDAVLSDRKIISFGHSTGGPMSISLQSFLQHARVAGIVGWASGGPDGWYREWLMWIRAKSENVVPLDFLARRTAAAFRNAGYEDEAELTPWGDADGYMVWGDIWKSQLKTSVCENQHKANIDILMECARSVRLPSSEYLDHLLDPDPVWLSQTPVLLLVGEKDRNHWSYGKETEDKLEVFMGRKFEQRTPRAKVMLLPRYGHYGYVGLYNEKIAYVWLQALADGFFG